MNSPSLIRLILAELRRIGRRRATVVTAAVFAVLLALTGVRTFTTSSDAPPDLAAAQEQATLQTADCRASMTADGSTFSDADLAAMCHVDPQWLVVDRAYHLQSLLLGNGSTDWADVRETALSRDSWMVDSAGTMRESPADGFSGDIVAFATLVAFVGAALGATYVGADWRSGVIESQSIWMPNRRRLFGAKLAAVAVSGGLLGLIASWTLVLVLLPSALWRGDTAGTGGYFWLDVTATSLRASVATAVFVLLAASIAMLARNTAAGMIGLFGWSVTAGILAERVAGWVAYVSPYANVKAFIAQGDVAILETVRLDGGGSESFYAASHGWTTAGLTAVVIVLAAIALAGTSFVRRDIS